ncbi:hypothetical protein JVT61DRAFT_9747 [Boletus reticuloceps]|uniref:Uncharacterized protein n=1 Tax=Boletus reticuloceps TaxID=495285 RepID=A0A8I2YG61_9AGAM|nr:hypothetical protein JVT61DRAFT_9747 [Boletus reticuloceps]
MSSNGPVFQNSVYVGINLQDILYGVELVLYFKTMHVLLSSKVRHKKSDKFYVLFSSVMLLMITVWLSTQAIFGEEMWIVNANFSGGPDAYWARNVSAWYMDMGTTAIIILQLMTDGLMIYRCRMISDSYRVIVVPVILWLGTLVLGILVLVMSSSPGEDFFSGIAAQLGIAYYSLSVGLTAMLTWVICYRMVTHGREAKKQLGAEYASVYFSLLSIIIESVLPYTLSGIAFLVSFGMGSGTSITFACVYILMMMLILRVAYGQAWDETAKERPSTLKFNTATGTSGWTESNCLEENGA